MLGLFGSITLGVKITLSLLGLLVFLAYRFFTKHFGYWKSLGVKFVKPVPVFGSVGSQFMLKDHPMQWAQKVYQKYEGEPFVGYYLGRTPALMVMDPQLIKNIFVKDFSHFMDHGFKFHEEADPLNAKNLFMMNGQKWKDMRTKLVPTFTSGKMKAMFPLILECADQFDEHLQIMANAEETFEAKDLLGCLFTDVIGSCIFGISTNTIKEPNSPFRTMGKRLIEVNLFQALKTIIILFVPEIAMKLKLGILEPDVTEFFRTLVKDMMEKRKKSNVIRKDFIQLLIELKEKGSISVDAEEEDDKDLENAEMQSALKNTSSYKFSDDDLTAQATVFFLAGFETSSTVLSYTLLELAAYPDVQRKAQLEIDEALGQNDGKITYESLKDMKYLDWILQETMRKYPPVTIHNRTCTKTYQVPGTNVTIEEGFAVLIPNHALQNDPKYFPNPDRFDPERFSDDDALHKYQYIYSPFGEGPRQCIGNRFALVQSKLALLIFLRKYTVSFCKKTVYPVNFDVKQFIITPKDGAWLKLENRQEE